MPIYEFHCERCDKDSELLVRSSKWKDEKCPHCGSTRLNKKLSVFASAESHGHSHGGGEAHACRRNGGGGGCCGGHCGGH